MLANHWEITKFAKVFPRQCFALYGINYRVFGLIALDHVSFSGWPVVKIKSKKTENEAFTEFKCLKKPTIRYIELL